MPSETYDLAISSSNNYGSEHGEPVHNETDVTILIFITHCTGGQSSKMPRSAVQSCILYTRLWVWILVKPDYVSRSVSTYPARGFQHCDKICITSGFSPKSYMMGYNWANFHCGDNRNSPTQSNDTMGLIVYLLPTTFLLHRQVFQCKYRQGLTSMRVHKTNASKPAVPKSSWSKSKSENTSIPISLTLNRD